MLKKVMFGVVTIFILTIIVGSFRNPPGMVGGAVTESNITTSQSTEQNVAERVFKQRLTYYDERENGVILVEYRTAQTTLSQVKTEIKRFMNEFMRERGDDPFEYVGILATTEGYDSYGKKQTVAVFSVEFHYEDAIKVDSWPFADVEKVGVVLYENPAWR